MGGFLGVGRSYKRFLGDAKGSGFLDLGDLLGVFRGRVGVLGAGKRKIGWWCEWKLLWLEGGLRCDGLV